MGKITKAERQELRSAVRTRFRVLRREIEQRKMELIAELDEQLRDKFAAADAMWIETISGLDDIVRDANKKANDYFRGRKIPGYYEQGRIEYNLVYLNTQISKPRDDRMDLRREGLSKIDAMVEAAKLRLETEEADLLQRLIVDSLESDAARAFLGSIPTVSALVPADRLLAIVNGPEGR